jgi:hypothetical protein
MEVVYKNRNVYTDVSGLTLGGFSAKFERFMRNQVEEMLTWAGEPRYMLYGTDWPICAMDSYLQFMSELELPKASMEKIMWRNAAELFKIDVAHLAGAVSDAVNDGAETNNGAAANNGATADNGAAADTQRTPGTS